MPNQQSGLDQVFHALGDATRRAVLARLSRGPANVTELARHHDMALPSFMQHLGVLEESGLIRTRKKGRVRTCRLASGRMRQAEGWLASQRRLWERRLDQLDSYLLEMKEERR